MKRKIWLIALSVFAVVVQGCGGTENSTEQDVAVNKEEETGMQLTERQKDILRLSGLSDDYEELDALEKNSISAIENMLVYLEKKYSGEFVYKGYIPGGGIEKEELICYKADDPSKREISVIRTYENGDLIYADNYQEVMAGESYTAALKGIISEVTGAEEILILSTVSSLPEGEDDNILKASAFCTVLISKDVCTEEQMEELYEKIQSRIGETRGNGSSEIRMFLLSREAFSDVIPGSYESVLEEYGWIKNKTVSIPADRKE